MRDRVCLFLANRSNAYQAAMEREAVLAAARHQLPLEVHDARGSTPRQLEQMMEVLRAPTARQVYAAMVLPLDDVIHERAGREAVRGGIGWVLLNRQAEYIEDLRLGYPALPLFSLTPDHRQIGRAQAAIVKALLPRGGKVLSVTGPLTAVSARLRREGLDHGLEGAGFQIAHLPGDWTRPGGEQAIRAWELRVEEKGGVRHPILCSFFPDIVVAQNDAMAEGARRALDEASRWRRWHHIAGIPVVGCDGTREHGLRLVEEKTLSATVVIPATAGSALDLLAAQRQGGPRPGAVVQQPVSPFPALDQLAPVQVQISARPVVG
jgi:ABC-type sugar transport system substrate-binding protein